MKKNILTYLGGMVVLCSLLSSCVSTPSPSSNTTPNSTRPQIVTPNHSLTKDKEEKYTELTKTDHFDTITIKEELDYLTTDISYPSFDEYIGLDKYVENLVQSGWNEFKEKSELSWKEIAELNSYSLPPYEYYVKFSVFDNKNIISIYLEIYSFNGGAHGQTNIKTVNYDKNTEKFLTITEATNLSYEELAECSRKYLYKTLIEDEKFEIDGETVLLLDEMREEGTYPIAGNYEAFTINDDILSIYFEPAKVAPHYYGIQTVEIKLQNK